MSFLINYFNGKSSKTYPATIKTNTSSWKIIFTEDTGLTKEINWKIDRIRKSEVYTKGLVSFSYGDSFPFQKIESNDVNFINYIAKSEHENINNKLDTYLHKSVKKSIIILALTIICFSAGMYLYVIPSIAVSFAKNLPKKGVITFGNYVFNTLSHQLEINEHRSEKLQDFVNALNLGSEFTIKAYVSESEELNAFALSGGTFVIYTGLLDKIESEHQLSALIGHEVSHIENRHVLKNVTRNLSGALFLSIIFGDVNAITSIISENAHLFSQLSFTRGLEKEADIFGLEIMRENNLDLEGMPQLFEILNNQDNQIDVPSFLNSHPMLDDRIEYTRKIANQQESFIPNIELKEKWRILKEDTNSNNKNNE